MEARVLELAGAQFNRIARWQLHDLGVSDDTIDALVRRGLLIVVRNGVFGVPPVLSHDQFGRWMEATLTEPFTHLSHLSASNAYEVLDFAPRHLTVTRIGNGGPRLHDGVIVHRSTRLEAQDLTFLAGIPITTIERTLLDLASQRSITDKALARAIRVAIRKHHTSLYEIANSLGRYRGRRGAGRVGRALARFAKLPIHRARSGAEVLALEILRDAMRKMPMLNVKVAGEEADLVWKSHRLIIEIDGGPFHQDKGEDERKQRIWEAAGWTVLRIDANDIYNHPQRLLELAP